MQKLILIILTLFSIQSKSFSQASSVENLKRATAREIGNNTRTEDVTISNIKRKATSVKWAAKINNTCYECDADDMVRNVHVVKLDCSLIPVEEPNNSSPTKSGPKDPLGAAIHKKIQEDKAKREGSNAASQSSDFSETKVSSPQQSESKSNNSEDVIEQLKKWKKLLDEGIINQQEFDEQKRKLLEGK